MVRKDRQPQSIGNVQGRYIKLQYKEKKEEIWLSPMTKAPTPTEKSKKQRDNTKTLP